MGLRDRAAADLAAIMSDTAQGFGWPLTLRAPDGRTATVRGYFNDISRTIDPGTGEQVSGEYATAVIHMSEILSAGLGIPQDVNEVGGQPWQLITNDILGNERRFKISPVDVDRSVGAVTFILADYETWR